MIFMRFKKRGGVTMAFKKVDCIAEKKEIMSKDAEIREYIQEFDKQYEIMQSIVKTRREIGLTQKEISKRSGLTQQMVSRMEKVDNSPTLANFLKYISALGLEINIRQKKA